MQNNERFTNLGDNLVICGQALAEIGRTLMQLKAEDMPLGEPTNDTTVQQDNPMEPETAQEDEPMQYDDIRATLAEKTHQDDGRFRADIMRLIRKYSDSGKLSDVAQSDYAELVAEVQALGATDTTEMR